jgi:hypothetical protein
LPTVLIETSQAPPTVSEVITTPSEPSAIFNDYFVSLDVHPKDRVVTGIETIRFINTTDVELSEIYINILFNAFSKGSESVSVFSEYKTRVFGDVISYGYLQINQVNVDSEPASYEMNDTNLRIELLDKLMPNDFAEIRLEFEAEIPLINHRTGSNNNSMWFGNFLPTLAVFDADGWHTDSYTAAGDPFFTETANFVVNVTAPPEYTAVGSGSRKVTEQPEKTITEFVAQRTRDFAFALGSEYKVVSLVNDNVEINLYTFSDITNADKIVNLAARSLEYYSSRIGSYPYPQLTIVEVGLFIKGGMEYPQLVFLDSDYLQNSIGLESLAHEIGHQWFYNLIGNNQIDSAWMDEGLTTFIQEGLFLTEEELRLKMADNYDYLTAALPTIIPNDLDSGLSEFTKWSDYYCVHYMRGELLFYNLYLKMGADVFDEFIKTYYSNYSFHIASPKNLIDTAEEVSGLNLSDFFNKWIYDSTLPELYS